MPDHGRRPALSELRSLNFNDYVWVWVTPRGFEIAEEQDARWSKLYGATWGRAAVARREQENGGYSRWQLWALIETFGHALYLGCQPPFELTVYLSDPALPASSEGAQGLDHSQCHDLVCNCNRAEHPRGARGVGCSCRSRAERDCIELVELHAENARLRAEGAHGWQAISTAPKHDYESVLGCLVREGDFEIRTTHWDPHEAAWMKDKAYRDTKDRWNPTHWMPLPDPPALLPSSTQEDQT
jgi:hypothetical protein